MRLSEVVVNDRLMICGEFENAADLADLGRKATAEFPFNGQGYGWVFNQDYPSSLRGHFGKRMADWPDVFNKLEAGCSESATMMADMMQQIEAIELPAPRSARRRLKYDRDDGDEIDLDRLDQNQPFWRTTERSQVIGERTVTIIADIAAAAAYDHKAVLWRAACAYVIASILEKAGYSVELHLADLATSMVTSDYRHCRYLTWCCVKRLGDPLDLSSVATLGAGWAYRTAWWYSTIYATRRFSNECGVGGVGPIGDVEVSLITSDQNAFVVRDVWSMQTAVDYVRRVLFRFVETGNLEDPRSEEERIAECMTPDGGLTETKLVDNAAAQDVCPPLRKFNIGKVLVTRGAAECVGAIVNPAGDHQMIGKKIMEYVERHSIGDWGDLDAHDRRANDAAMGDEARILSSYNLPGGERLWIITEADRSSTTVLLPSEY